MHEQLRPQEQSLLLQRSTRVGLHALPGHRAGRAQDARSRHAHRANSGQYQGKILAPLAVKVELKSGTVNYLDQGNGPAVLLIHAFPLNHTMWAPQLGPLSERFRVVAPDVRGFGE